MPTRGQRRCDSRIRQRQAVASITQPWSENTIRRVAREAPSPCSASHLVVATRMSGRSQQRFGERVRTDSSGGRSRPPTASRQDDINPVGSAAGRHGWTRQLIRMPAGACVVTSGVVPGACYPRSRSSSAPETVGNGRFSPSSWTPLHRRAKHDGCHSITPACVNASRRSSGKPFRYRRRIVAIRSGAFSALRNICVTA